MRSKMSTLENPYYKLVNHEIIACGDLIEWAQWFETADRHIFLHKVGEMTISTVFLGIDHSWRGKPILFETMIFGGPINHEYQTRCASLDNTHTMHYTALDVAMRLDSFRGLSWRRVKKACGRKTNWLHDYLPYCQKEFRRYYGKNIGKKFKTTFEAIKVTKEIMQ